MGAVAPGACASDAREPERLRRLTGLSALPGTMCEASDDEAVMALATAAVAALGRFLTASGYLRHKGVLVRSGGTGTVAADGPEMDAGVVALHDEDGALDLPGSAWAWAFGLRNVEGCGYLVVRSAVQPSAEEILLVSILAGQTAAALATAAERAHVAELQRQAAERDAANARLRAKVAELDKQTMIREALARVSVSGEGEQGLVRVVHELTGLAAVSEDRFGNLRAWAGPGRPDPYPVPERGRREELVQSAGRSPGPLRERDRLIFLARVSGEVLGVLALVDPDGTAGATEEFVLEQAAMLLALELSHARSLAETELRLRGDLVEDLVTGTDEQSAYARSEAVGHDLHGPHHVAVVQWSGPWGDGTVTRAVSRAAATLGLRFMLGRRAGTVVLLVGGDHVTEELHKAVSHELSSATGAIGVGGRCDVPAHFPHSYQEALRALEVRQKSLTPHGLSTFDDLGLYRLLDTHAGQTEQFVREWLGELLNYDSAHHGDLVATLSVYLECGGGYDATAETLAIHRSTLRYRLQRIREITRLDLADVDVRLNLHVATRIWRVLAGPG